MKIELVYSDAKNETYIYRLTIEDPAHLSTPIVHEMVVHKGRIEGGLAEVGEYDLMDCPADEDEEDEQITSCPYMPTVVV